MKLLVYRWRILTNTPERTLSRLVNSGIVFSRARRGEECIFFDTSPLEKKKVERVMSECGFEGEFVRVGFLSPLFLIAKRPGIVLGLVISIFLIYLSTFFVWSVRIEGNSSVGDREIVELLRECGFYEGVRKSAVDTNEVQNVALARCHELSFLSINVHGAVAEVEVHERVRSTKEPDPTLPYNLVADIDGVIVSTLILDGQLMVKAGDTVVKGELLVSGLMESTSGSVRTGHSRGKVFARTTRSLAFDVPLVISEKKYVGEEEHTALRVLGKRIGRRLGAGDYDTVVTEEPLSFFGFSLPMTLERRALMYYETCKVALTEEEAYDRAYDEYKRYIMTELDSASITEEKFSYEIKEDVLYFTAEVSAIENIAVEQKIERL